MFLRTYSRSCFHIVETTSPFDLNVLCTPPAFILSQDQTLEQIVYQPSPVNIKCVELVALFTFWVCIPFYRDVFQRMTRFSHLLLSCLYLNLLLFNCQWSIAVSTRFLRFRYRFCRGSLVDSLSIISRSHPLVKRFSKLFSKKFWACRSGGVYPFPSARLADYITFPAACQGGGEDFFRGGAL